MQISTTRFGFLTVQPEDIIQFPAGILGLEDCRRWVLLADEDNESLAWLQSTSYPEVALAVVNPRRYVPGYQLRVTRGELERLQLSTLNDAEVLAIVGRHDGALTLNLKAPLLINVPRCLGRQVITDGDAAVRHMLRPEATSLKRVA